LFFEGRAWPILNLLIAERLDDEKSELAARKLGFADQTLALAKLDADLRQSIAAGSDDLLELGSYTGPVSVNPTGVCEGGYYSLFDAGSTQARWNSFNVGEFWFPESRWSVLPLLALVALLSVGLARESARSAAPRRDAFAEFEDAIPVEKIAAD
jgi:hypothetical protein